MMHTADDVRRLLAENESLMRRSREQDRVIKDAARQELDRVTARLNEMLPGRVAREPALANEYQRLVSQRGQLLMMAG